MINYLCLKCKVCLTKNKSDKPKSTVAKTYYEAIFEVLSDEYKDLCYHPITRVKQVKTRLESLMPCFMQWLIKKAPLRVPFFDLIIVKS